MLKQRYTDDSLVEIGIDEAGRGCFWGPLVAGAVCWPSEDQWTNEHRDIVNHIKDSKKISPKKRERIYDSICKLSLGHGVGLVHAEEIDKYGATWANQTAFRRAIESLTGIRGSRRYLIDGVLPLASLKEGENQLTIIDGDATYLSIAAASIVAKVSHDRWLQEWCLKEENKECAERYDLVSCKGYGTAKHRAGILQHGYTPLHRKLYLRKLLPSLVIERYLFKDD
jgi:ribonuclease HII